MAYLPRPLAATAVVLAFVLAACSSAPESSGDGDAPSADAGGEIIEITVGTDDGAELLFDPTEITVPAGATIRLTFNNESTVPHNLTFDDPINAATENIVDPGASETIEFTAPESGEYTYVCTLHPGMEGTLIVEGAS